jgi:hypothetical protein
MLSLQRCISLKFLLASHLTPWQIGMVLQLQAKMKHQALYSYVHN